MDTKVHVLKCDPKYFEKILNGSKNFECRFNDRNFQQGDIASLQEYDRDTKIFSGRVIDATIGYVLDDFEGLAEGYVVFSLLDIKFYNFKK